MAVAVESVDGVVGFVVGLVADLGSESLPRVRSYTSHHGCNTLVQNNGTRANWEMKTG